MEWQDLIGRTIVAAVPTRSGKPDGTIPNVLHLRFSDGTSAIICCNYASHERPWLDIEEEAAEDDPWLADEGDEGVKG
jgi:hypothetical protein